MGRALPTLTLLRSDGLPVVERCSVADTPSRRLRGPLGRPVLAEGEGIVLRPSWGIYTGFLPAPIDAIFLSADQTVLRIVEGLKPFRFACCRGARDVVEARAGTCRERRLDEGHSVTWAAFSPDGTVPTPERPAGALRHRRATCLRRTQVAADRGRDPDRQEHRDHRKRREPEPHEPYFMFPRLPRHRRSPLVKSSCLRP
jgi:uncharacterized membrane protein (UPF0127 family)